MHDRAIRERLRSLTNGCGRFIEMGAAQRVSVRFRGIPSNGAGEVASASALFDGLQPEEALSAPDRFRIISQNGPVADHRAQHAPVGEVLG